MPPPRSSGNGASSQYSCQNSLWTRLKYIKITLKVDIFVREITKTQIVCRRRQILPPPHEKILYPPLLISPIFNNFDRKIFMLYFESLIFSWTVPLREVFSISRDSDIRAVSYLYIYIIYTDKHLSNLWQIKFAFTRNAYISRVFGLQSLGSPVVK